MKDVFVVLVSVFAFIFVARYTYQIIKGDISPTLSTWIMFLTGTGLSLITYFLAEDWDIRSGIYNATDFISVLIVLSVIIFCGNREIRFQSFEKWYLIGIALIVGFGITTGNAWKSNIFTQALITIGYIPTIHRLVQEKKNTESYTAWGCTLIAALLALYPAIKDGNSLATIYTIRAIILVSFMLTMMIYYQYFYKSKK